jgi:hypothetical protein
MNIKNIYLPYNLISQLINLPETGMGYHKVDFILKNGDVIKNQIILNSSILKLDNSIKFSIENIESVILSK